MTYFGQRGTHRGKFDETLYAWSGWEDVAEEVPEAWHALLRPYHSCDEEEHEAEEYEAEHGRNLLSDDEVGDCHCKEDDGQKEGEAEDENGVEIAQLRQVEPSRYEPQVDDADGEIDEEVAECSSDGHTMDARPAQV